MLAHRLNHDGVMMELFVIPPFPQPAPQVDSVLGPQGTILPWLLVAVSSTNLHQLGPITQNYLLFIYYLFYLFSLLQNLTQHEQKVLIKL